MAEIAAGRPDWQRHAKCAGHPDPSLFHGRDGERAEDRRAREDVAIAFCRDGCPVRQECLIDALDRGDREGVWGGTTPEQRAQLQRIARAVAADQELREAI